MSFSVLLGDLRVPLFGALLQQSSSTRLEWQGRPPWFEDVLRVPTATMPRRWWTRGVLDCIYVASVL